MVFKLATKHKRSVDHQDELVGIGNVALCEAADTFPEKPRKCRFSTYAYQRIEASMIHSFRTSKGVLSSTEWEGRTDSRKQRQWTQLAQDLGREPTMEEFSFVYGEEIHVQPTETPVESIDAEYSVKPVNGHDVDMERMPLFARIVVQEVSYGMTSGDVLMEASQNLSIPPSEVRDVLRYASDYIHFS